MTEQHNTVLVDGKGQAREGKGHDAFDEIPYDRLDRIRIVSVKLEKDNVSIVGDATSAYEPEVGLKGFTRRFTFTKADGFVITDELAGDRPRVFTSMLHADEKIEQAGRNQFTIRAGAASLRAEILEPRSFNAKIEPNFLTAAGAPGSVDKGERQQRGERLAISTANPSSATRFVMTLKIAPSITGQ